MSFSPLFGQEKECWRCRRTHPEFLPCSLWVSYCIGCGEQLMSLERWQTLDSQGRVHGPLCEGCFRAINPEWFSAMPIRFALEPGCFDPINIP